MSIRFKFALLFSALQILLACSIDSSKTAADKSAPVQGTGDGGGGNAIDNKMLESYIIDPAEIPAVQKYVLPILQKIATNEKGQYQSWMKMKTWYRVPVKLSQIPRATLGVPYSEEKLQQVAIQTDAEIWIDDQVFSKMSEIEQAKLVMHEVVMMRYLSRFEKISDLCAKMERGGQSCQSDSNSELDFKEMDKIYEPEEKRDLTAADYNIIRTVTSWIFSNSTTISKEEFEAYAQRSGLSDSRFGESSKPVDKEKKISFKDLELLISAAKYTNELPRECYSVSLNKKFKCEVSIELKDSVFKSKTNVTKADGSVLEQDFETKVKALVVKVKDLELGTEFSTAGSVISNDDIRLNFGNGYYSFAGLSISLFGEAANGNMGHLVALQVSSDLTKILGVEIIPFVKVGEREISQAEVNKGNTASPQKCKKIVLGRPRSDQVLETHLVISNQDRIKKNSYLWDKIKMNEIKSCN